MASPKIKVIVIATQKYWYCIPKKFSDCPTEPVHYDTETELEEITRSEHEIVGKCSTAIKVTNKYGFEANIFPKKIIKK